MGSGRGERSRFPIEMRQGRGSGKVSGAGLGKRHSYLGIARRQQLIWWDWRCRSWFAGMCQVVDLAWIDGSAR